MTNLQLLIYAFQLEDNKFYVGKTNQFEGFNGVEVCYQQHLAGLGCKWTQLHKPISIVESYECDNAIEDTVLTKRYMMKYGIENVRGGAYANVELDNWQVAHLEQDLQKEHTVLLDKLEYGPLYPTAIMGVPYPEFKTEYEIEAELARLENMVTIVNQLYNDIFNYKYVQIMYDEKDVISVEIEPSIIDAYGMRYLPRHQTRERRDCAKTFSERLYASLLRYKDNGNKPNILRDENVVQNVYKVYIYRKKLEKQYMNIIGDLANDSDNADKVIKNINKKIELLYMKLSMLYEE